MKKLISCLIMILMIWTVVDKQGLGHSSIVGMVITIENTAGVRKVLLTNTTTDIIVGDKVEYIPRIIGKWSWTSQKESIRRIK